MPVTLCAMALETRRLRDDAEFAQYLQAANYAFNGPRGDSDIQRYRDIVDPAWCLGTFDDKQLVAGLTIIPFEQYLGGSTVPFGGIASVASLPERRREGAVAMLLRATLAVTHEGGQPLSGLYTPHYSLYRRFGWEISHDMVARSFAPKLVTTRRPRPAGQYRRVKADDWPVLARMREAFVSERNGALKRDEKRWRKQVFSNDGKGEHDAIVWTNAAGEDRGYAVYRQDHRQRGGPWGETVLRVLDWIALDGEAYSGLLNYVLGHDLVDEIVMLLPSDDPILMTIDEPTHMKSPAGNWIGMLTRIVDVKQAFESRPSMSGVAGEITLALSDAAAPWNEDTWRITSDGTSFSVEKSDRKPDLMMDITALAPLFNGFLTCEASVRSGQVESRCDGAAPLFTEMMRMPQRPFCPDEF